MSVSDAGRRALRIREVFDSAQPQRTASSLAEIRASSIRSRSRTASASRADCALEEGEAGIGEGCGIRQLIL
jgi:hypothetical protein